MANSSSQTSSSYEYSDGEKKYRCPVVLCGKQFRIESFFIKHIATHSELKYVCKTCSEPFQKSEELKKHEENTHLFMSPKEDPPKQPSRTTADSKRSKLHVPIKVEKESKNKRCVSSGFEESDNLLPSRTTTESKRPKLHVPMKVEKEPKKERCVSSGFEDSNNVLPSRTTTESKRPKLPVPMKVEKEPKKERCVSSGFEDSNNVLPSRTTTESKRPKLHVPMKVEKEPKKERCVSSGFEDSNNVLPSRTTTESKRPKLHVPMKVEKEPKKERCVSSGFEDSNNVLPSRTTTESKRPKLHVPMKVEKEPKKERCVSSGFEDSNNVLPSRTTTESKRPKLPVPMKVEKEPKKERCVSSGFEDSNNGRKKSKRVIRSITPSAKRSSSSLTSSPPRKKMRKKAASSDVSVKKEPDENSSSSDEESSSSSDEESSDETKKIPNIEKEQKCFTTYMSLESILGNEDSIKSKIESDVDASSKIKILTSIFVNFIMNYPNCTLAKKYAIFGFQHYKIMNCFKEKTPQKHKSSRENDPELYDLLDEFKKKMADEKESEFYPVMWETFKKKNEKRKWKNNAEMLEKYNEYRIDLLTTIDCKLKTELLKQAGSEMDKDLKVHLQMEGPKILKKFLTFQEFGMEQKNKKKDVPAGTKHNCTENGSENEVVDEVTKRRQKRNKRRRENWKIKIEKRKEENKLNRGKEEPCQAEKSAAKKEKRKLVQTQVNETYTRSTCKNREMERAEKLKKEDNEKEDEEKKRNQETRIKEKNDKIDKRNKKNMEEQKEKTVFKKNKQTREWTVEEIKEKKKKVKSKFKKLMKKSKCKDKTLNRFLEEIRKEKEELTILVEDERRKKEEIKKTKQKVKKKESEETKPSENEKKRGAEKETREEGEKEKEKPIKVFDFKELYCLEKCYKFLPLFVKLQKFFIENNAGGFILYPMRKLGLHHATYTLTIFETDVLSHMGNIRGQEERIRKLKVRLKEEDTKHQKYENLKEPKTKEEKKEAKKQKEKASLDKKHAKLKIIWDAFFDMKNMKKNKNKRAYSVPQSMQTDGKKVSLIFTLKERIKNVSIEKTTKGQSIKYERFVGLDPGLRAMVGGVVRHNNVKVERDEETQKVRKSQDTRIYVKATSFRFRAGEFRRREKTEKYKEDIEKKYNDFMSKNKVYNEVNKKDPSKYELLAKFNFKRFEMQQKTLSKRCFTNLKFNKLIMTRREIDRMANFIAGSVNEKPCLVALGQTKISPVMKGHVRTPVRKVEKRLKERSKEVGEDKLKIVPVYEAYSTVICSSCNNRHIVSRSPKRYAFCKKCHVVWDRDVNAGINILHIALINEGLMQKEDIPQHQAFPGIKAKETCDPAAA